MATWQSQFEEFYLDLSVQLVRSDPLAICTPKHLRKDIETTKSRVQCEGLSFLTKSLPKLGKALDQGLENSRFTLPQGFRQSHGNRSIPAFMQEYFNLVFGCEGILRKDASAEAIKHLRQCLFFAYKLESPYSKETEERVISSFVNTDGELSSLDFTDQDANLEQMITEDVFRDFDPFDIVPRHGPGAVATGEKMEDKWVFTRKYPSIHKLYPYYRFFVVGGARELGDRLGWYRSLQPVQYGTAKVVLVPKDSRGPRLISCEPLEFQWIQQGLGRKLMHHLETTQSTCGNINFIDQEVNRKLTLESSRTREFATLDLKDASDRVSMQLVRKVFARTPKLLSALEACRTSATKLPSGEVIHLEKFAPMGSALCFPVEAYCFWVLIVAALARHGIPSSRGANLVKVYGDDIIVPTELAEVSIQALERYGLLVNRDKSCIKGFFRESCGMDAFNGVPVTPIRLKKPWTAKRSDGTALASYTSIANSLKAKGYTLVAEQMYRGIEGVYGTLPYGTGNSSFPCREVREVSHAIGLNRDRVETRWNGTLQRLEAKVLTVTAKSRQTQLDGWQRLLRDMVSGSPLNPSVV